MKLKRKYLIPTALVVLFVCMLFGYQNCMKSKSSRSVASRNPSEVIAGKSIPASPFESSKLIVIKNSKLTNQNQASTYDSNAIKLAALLDEDCAKSSGLDSLLKFKSEIELVDIAPDLKVHRKVYRLKLNSSVSESRLKEFAYASKCIIGVSNDIEYKVNSTINDPKFSQQTQHTFLHTEEFFNKATWLPVEDNERAVVAVIDTGVDYNHADLANMMFRKNGTIVGKSLVADTPDFLDDHGHGTHVAGLAAAEAGNGIGGLGVCGISCFIMPIKVLNSKGSGLSSDVNNGVFWAVDNGANVINLSLARTLNFVGMAPIDLEAFRYAMTKNVMVAVAAGNDGAVLDMDGIQSWPAMFAELPGVVTVASLDASTGALSTFSNRSTRYVEISAPGSTSSTDGVYVGLISTGLGGGYVGLSGTSMATPVVSGAIGLIISFYKKNKIAYTVWDIEAFLKSSTDSIPALKTFVEAGRSLNLSVLADKLKTAQESSYRLNTKDPFESFVIDLYYIILRRNYDDGGAQFTLNLMKNNKIPLESMIWNFMTSPEYISNFGNLNNRENDNYALLRDHLIPDAYLTILGHLPIKADLDYWSEYFSVFRSKNRSILRALLKSPEFDSRVAGNGLAEYPRMEKLPSDSNAKCIGKNFPVGDFSFEAQVDFSYCIALERTPDVGGKLFYLNLLKKGEKLETLILAMFRSSEFSAANTIDGASDREYVNILYYLLLQRLPAPHENFYWTDVLTKTTRDEVLKAFIASPEFNQLLITKGIRK